MGEETLPLFLWNAKGDDVFLNTNDTDCSDCTDWVEPDYVIESKKTVIINYALTCKPSIKNNLIF